MYISTVSFCITLNDMHSTQWHAMHASITNSLVIRPSHIQSCQAFQILLNRAWLCIKSSMSDLMGYKSIKPFSVCIPNTNGTIKNFISYVVSLKLNTVHQFHLKIILTVQYIVPYLELWSMHGLINTYLCYHLHATVSKCVSSIHNIRSQAL